MKKQSFIITGMSCAACQANITKRVRRLPGVESVEVSLLSGRMTAVYNPEAVDSAAIEAAGFTVDEVSAPHSSSRLRAAIRRIRIVGELTNIQWYYRATAR